jgi:hypothetical protein
MLSNSLESSRRFYRFTSLLFSAFFVAMKTYFMTFDPEGRGARLILTLASFSSKNKSKFHKNSNNGASSILILLISISYAERTFEKHRYGFIRLFLFRYFSCGQFLYDVFPANLSEWYYPNQNDSNLTFVRRIFRTFCWLVVTWFIH